MTPWLKTLKQYIKKQKWIFWKKKLIIDSLVPCYLRQLFIFRFRHLKSNDNHHKMYGFNNDTEVFLPQYYCLRITYCPGRFQQIGYEEGQSLWLMCLWLLRLWVLLKTYISFQPSNYYFEYFQKSIILLQTVYLAILIPTIFPEAVDASRVDDV